MSKVFVLNAHKQPLSPVSPARARILLTKGKAAVYRSSPFTLILRQVTQAAVPVPLRIKIDPGAKVTGLALVNDTTGEVVWAAELAHRGFARQTRYREPRWANRQRCAGWLPPSLLSRIANVLTWVKRLQRWCPLAALSLEVVKFDLQAMQNPEIEGRAYQQGELMGYELREYLLHKWQRKCAYCGKKGMPLQIDHIVPRSKGGTDRASNLTLACERCNQAKGDQDVQDFLKRKPAVLERMLEEARTPLRDAAAVNTTLSLLNEQLKGVGLPLESGSGGRTKYNRSLRGLPKTHWLDAACIGASTPEELQTSHVIPLRITAYGHGCRQVCLMDEHGFPRTKPKRKPTRHTFRTGDQVRAVVPARLTHAGVHVGRMASKASGAFSIITAQGRVTDIGYRYCVLIQHRDGYGYLHGKGGRDFLPVP